MTSQTFKPFKPPAHPQKAALWLMVAFMGISAVSTQYIRTSPMLGAQLVQVMVLVALIALAFPRILSHMPFGSARSGPYALYQGLWFGTFMGITLWNPDNPLHEFWRQFAMNGVVFGLIHFAFLTRWDTRQAESIQIQDFYAEPHPLPGGGWGHPLAVLGGCIALSVVGVPLPLVLLLMALLLNATPYARPIAPAHTQPALRLTLRLLRAGLAALALGVILMNGG